MKWTPYTPPLWDRRVRTGFLWRPLRLNGEVRWLERASWVEEYHDAIIGWEPIEWEAP